MEAATNLGASRWRIFRTVTIPMLIPGIAGSFLLLFVEAIADLGNPLVLGGNYEVLAGRSTCQSWACLIRRQAQCFPQF